jgi:hypothetical protein
VSEVSQKNPFEQQGSAGAAGDAQPRFSGAPEETAADQSRAEEASGNQQTGIKALVAVARHAGLDWSLQRLC